MSLITSKPKPLTLAYEPDMVTVRLYNRWYALRRYGREVGEELVPPILQEGPSLYTFSNPSDPWGSKERLSVETMVEMVEEAEEKAQGLRKGMTIAGTSTHTDTLNVQTQNRKEA
jgi:hypothetical protein